MNKSLYFCAGMLIGLAIGGVACLFCKNKFEQQAQKEIEEVRIFYSNKSKAAKNREKPTKQNPKKLNVDYGDCFKTENEAFDTYIGAAAKYGKPSNKAVSLSVIPPTEYGEDEDYERLSLIYYADGVLVDSQNIPVDNIADTVGEDFASHFGEYEDDSVNIRNDTRHCYYEILISERAYSEISKTLPPII